MNTLWIVLPVLTLLMFELGLTLDLRSFPQLLRRPAPVIAGLVGQIVLLPLLAFALGWVFRLDAVFFVGLVLIACSPGGSSSNVFTMVARGDVPLSILLTACSSILTLFTIPLIMRFAVQAAGGGADAPISLPVGSLIIQNLLLVFLPILAGVAVKGWCAQATARLLKILSKITVPALVLLVVIFFFQHRAVIAAQIGRLGACVASLVVLAMGGGWLLARIMGQKSRVRRTLVIEVGMQNAAQAIAVATSPFIFANEVMAIPAILYALLMNLILLGYIALLRRRAEPFTNC